MGIEKELNLKDPADSLKSKWTFGEGSEIEFSADKINEAFCTFDGKSVKSIYHGDTVRITKSPVYTNLVRLKDVDFYSLLNQKLELARNGNEK